MIQAEAGKAIFNVTEPSCKNRIEIQLNFGNV